MKRVVTSKFVRSMILISSLLAIVVLAACGSQAPAAAPATPRDPIVPVSFSKDVMPIFQASCVKCHGVEKVSRGLDLTTYDKAMAGSVKGPVIVAGNSAGSTLFNMVQQGKMPKQGAQLTAAQLEILKSWIDAGASNN
jgi:hypothetical protein